MYKLKKRDYELINQIIEATQIVSDIYDKLYELEKAGKKDSDEYLKIIEYLSMTIDDFEAELYQELNLTLEKGLAIIKYLKSDILFALGKTDEMLDNFSGNNRIIRRIILSVKSVMYKSKEFLNYSKSFFNQNIIEVQKSTKIDFNNLVIVLLQEQLAFEAKDYLLQAKYNFIFINKDLEEALIKSGFNIFKVVDSQTIMTTMFSEAKGENETNIVIDNFLLPRLKYQILSLLDITDEEYDKEDKKEEFKLTEILIRSMLILISDYTIEEINYKLNQGLESNEYLNMHRCNTKSEEEIHLIFRGMHKDKQKVFKLNDEKKKNIDKI